MGERIGRAKNGSLWELDILVALVNNPCRESLPSRIWYRHHGYSSLPRDKHRGYSSPPCDKHRGYSSPPCDRHCGYSSPPCNRLCCYNGPPCDSHCGYSSPPATDNAVQPGNQPVSVSVAPIHKKKSWKRKSARLEREDERAGPSQGEEEEKVVDEMETTQSLSLSELRDIRKDFCRCPGEHVVTCCSNAGITGPVAWN
ncbi:hypothetical protein QYF61_007479 [Mycteria americana]|uniref:Uncharacterized protein n=1 Tax=Mycteria americana TaxID=33587 RepID=A0AAN7RKN9_MYCAM|nr:hypothetical protein QYF61_007479 [Mycteria americana]